MAGWCIRQMSVLYLDCMMSITNKSQLPSPYSVNYPEKIVVMNSLMKSLCVLSHLG